MGAIVQTDALVELPREIMFDGLSLTVLSGVDVGKHAESTGAEVTIGHEEDNGLVISDTAVSRYHCSITVTEQGFILRDLGSRNGTFLASHRIVEAYLEQAAILEVGRTTIRFEILSGRHRETLAPEVAYGAMVGRSAPMRRIFNRLDLIAPTDKTILLLGDPGVGKSTLAREIHRKSNRGLFVSFDCASVPSSLMANELFGSEKGAFTGADRVHRGVFERAHTGTLFLDEIGELDLESQKSLLRAIETKTVQRLGGTEPLLVDVRIIAATNRDLRAAVNAKAFRQDLFQRLNSFPLHIPPLRDRPEDVSLLVERFYAEFAPKAGPPPTMLLTHLQQLSAHLSVRELRTEVDRFVVLGWDGLEIEQRAEPRHSHVASSGPQEAPGESPDNFKRAKARVIDEWERGYLSRLILRTQGNISEAARRAGLNRDHLRDLLKKHGLHEGS